MEHLVGNREFRVGEAEFSTDVCDTRRGKFRKRTVHQVSKPPLYVGSSVKLSSSSVRATNQRNNAPMRTTDIHMRYPEKL